MSETVPIKEHNHLFDLYDADGFLVGKANPGKKVMLADAFYVPERTCRVECYPPGYEDNLHYEVCSECGAILTAMRPGDRHAARASYCPECGARVIGEEAGDDD